MLRHLIILVTVLFPGSAVRSQPSWRVDKLDVADGLSQGYVYVIHQDKKGFIWIGTHGGLNRYDGYRFKVFQNDPFNSSTLGDNAVFFLKEDSITGKFWIGGSSYLNEFDPENFTNVRYHYTKKQLEFSDGIFINPHELLLACEYAILVFNTREKTFLEVPAYDENNKVISLSRVENVAADKKGNFMIMSSTGIFFYDDVSKSCKRKTPASPDFSSFNKYEIFNVFGDSKGYYWIATNKKGLIRFDPTSNKSITVSLPAPLINETIRFEVVLEDSHNYIWAGSSNGLFRIDPITLVPEYFSTDNSTGASLSHNEINAIREDKNHFMWIGTVGRGVNKMIPRISGFKHLSLIENTSGATTGTYIMTLEQMNDDLWFANIWDQVGRINMQTGKKEILSRPPLPDRYSWYSEGVILKSKKDELSILNGEYHYRVADEGANRVSIQSNASPGLYYIHHSKGGKTWYMVKAPVEKTFIRNDTIYGNQFFYDAREDNEGNMWIGSSKGLIKFNSQQNRFTDFQHDDNNSNTISSDFIYALEIDDAYQNIWMAAYNGGLCSYNLASGKFHHYSREDGLSDNTVYSIEKDNHGNLWFSSNAGITSYDTNSKTFRNYGVSDGLLNHEFNRRASFKNDKGWLFFGGVSGIDYFHPDSIVKNNTNSNLVFTNFKIFNNDYLPSKKGAIPVVELKPNDRYITVDFASLDYNDQQKIQYSYRINSNEWIKTGNQNTLSFSGLATGSHHLYVRSTNSEGNWLDNEIDCLIVVHPWWWQTWWFRTGIGLFGIGILIGSIRFYYHRKLEKQKVILERQQAVEKERTRIATDMHDDLGANLSRIKFLSETIGIKRQKQETIEDELSSIRHYSHEMIDKMGEIVWALNEKNDSLSDLLAYTRSYMVEYLSQNGIHSVVQIPDQIPSLFVSGEFRRNIYLTVKEALHNIVKHSQANKVDICVKTGQQLSISIRDNGKGFDEKNIRPFSNGITSMKQRIASLGGNLDIKNTEGSTIILEVPLP
ncbi:MAG TPA: two-component regulator propeller domain-containing protein [Cyclobacteriaceae bacterium]|nr:two-component regulator propeller domain-containing protein [Cyclobacteriaceae bacterium]